MYKRTCIGCQGSATLLLFPAAWDQSDVTEYQLCKGQKGLSLHPGSTTQAWASYLTSPRLSFPICKAENVCLQGALRIAHLKPLRQYSVVGANGVPVPRGILWFLASRLQKEGEPSVRVPSTALTHRICSINEEWGGKRENAGRGNNQGPAWWPRPAVPSKVATSHLWLLSTRHEACPNGDVLYSVKMPDFEGNIKKNVKYL